MSLKCKYWIDVFVHEHIFNINGKAWTIAVKAGLEMLIREMEGETLEATH